MRSLGTGPQGPYLWLKRQEALLFVESTLPADTLQKNPSYANPSLTFG